MINNNILPCEHQFYTKIMGEIIKTALVNIAVLIESALYKVGTQVLFCKRNRRRLFKV